MKKFFIFLSFMTVFIFAVTDYIDYINKLKGSVAIKTPAQVEIKKDILKPARTETQNIVKPNLTTPRDSSFNEKLKKQQDMNIPQFKQPNPLKN